MATEKSKRDLIIEAAILEFQDKGYESTSMDRITERAGVSKRTVYKHFECKTTLFRTIIDVLAARLKPDEPLEFDPALPVLDQLKTLGRVKAGMLRSTQFMHLVRMAMSETLRDPCLAQALRQKTEAGGDYTPFFAEAVKSGQLHNDDPAKIANQFIGLIKAQAFWPVIFSGEVLDEAQMDRIITESAETIVAAYGQ